MQPKWNSCGRKGRIGRFCHIAHGRYQLRTVSNELKGNVVKLGNVRR